MTEFVGFTKRGDNDQTLNSIDAHQSPGKWHLQVHSDDQMMKCVQIACVVLVTYLYFMKATHLLNGESFE